MTGASPRSSASADRCLEETHSDRNIEEAVPYEGAVDAVRRWHEAGHWIHVTSHRRESCAPATTRWLDAVGIPFDDLHCSFDKISRCVELDIDLLVDDSPVNITRAREQGNAGGHAGASVEQGAGAAGWGGWRGELALNWS